MAKQKATAKFDPVSIHENPMEPLGFLSLVDNEREAARRHELRRA